MTIPWFNCFAGRLLGLAVVVVVVVSGCSSKGKKVTVNGTVSYQGKAVPSGILKFSGPEGSYSAAVIQPDGTFIITDVVPGEVKVGVTQGPQGTEDSSGKKRNQPQEAQVSLPTKYLDPSTSGVTYTITPSTTKLNVEFP
jgi:hypothetical protein